MNGPTSFAFLACFSLPSRADSCMTRPSNIPHDGPPAATPLRLLYVACPTSLTLGSANAVQTWSTLKELRRLAPETRALVPRWLARAHALRRGGGGAPAAPRGGQALPPLPHHPVVLRGALALRRHDRGLCAPARPSAAATSTWPTCATPWPPSGGPRCGARRSASAWSTRPTTWRAGTPRGRRRPGPSAALRALDRTVLRESARVVSLTADFRRLLAERGSARPRHGGGHPRRVRRRRLPARRSRAPRGAPWDWPPTDRLVVYAGLTFSYRRLELLLQAVAAVRARQPALRAVFVGGRPAEIASLRDEAARAGRWARPPASSAPSPRTRSCATCRPPTSSPSPTP